MSVRNEARYLARTLDSLLVQDFQDFELIIFDNASEDDTRSICLAYAAQDTRIHYNRNEEDIGMANLSRVLGLASGRYFMFAAGHDLWHPTYISRCIEILEANPQAVLCYSRTMLIDSNNDTLGLTPDQIDTRNMSAAERYRYIIWKLSWCNMFYGIFRADVLRKIRSFKPLLGFDHAVLAELALRGEFVQIPEPLFYRRKNREDEDPEAYKQRVLCGLDPRNSWKSKKSYSELRRELALEHLTVVLHAPITYREKMALISETVYCFATRWGALGTRIARFSKLFLKSLLRKRLSIGEGR